MAERLETSGQEADADEHKVGYGRPPKHSQFKPGRSGNPKGRMPGARSFRADFGEELQTVIQLSENGEAKRFTKQRLVAKSLIAKAIKGDTRAAKLTIDQIDHLGLGEQEAGVASPLSATDEEILLNYIRSQARDNGRSNDD